MVTRCQVILAEDTLACGADHLVAIKVMKRQFCLCRPEGAAALLKSYTPHPQLHAFMSRLLFRLG